MLYTDYCKEKGMQGVYLIRCKSENKIYIGVSNNIRNRYNQHMSLLNKNKHPNMYLQSAFNQFGKNDFCCEILYEAKNPNVPKKELYDLEIYYISLYNSNNRNYGYNLESGGNSKGRVADETRHRLSKSLKGRKSPCYWTGKKMSQELRDKMSQNRKGKPSHWRGKKQTKEHAEKRARTQIGKVWVNNGEVSRFVSKEECKTLLEQGFNIGRTYFTRNTGKYEYQGKKYSLCEIARKCGIHRSVLFYRLKNGWSMEKATSTPIKK